VETPKIEVADTPKYEIKTAPIYNVDGLGPSLFFVRLPNGKGFLLQFRLDFDGKDGSVTIRNSEMELVHEFRTDNLPSGPIKLPEPK